MQLRWVAAIALWSMLIGPVLGPPLPRPSERAEARSSDSRPAAKTTPERRFK